MANARWSDTGTRPDWLDREDLNRAVIATSKGWVLRRNYTNGFSQSVRHEEVLVALGDLANTLGTPTPSGLFVANSAGGNTVRVGSGAYIGLSFDEGLLRKHANAGSGWKVTVANTANGNTVLAVANTTIAYANNTLYFNFVPGKLGTYKVQAQNIANSTAFLRAESNTQLVSLTISGVASNTLAAFAVVGQPAIRSMALANATGGSTYRVGSNVRVSITYDDDITTGNAAMLRFTVANTVSGNSVYARGLANTVAGKKVLFSFKPGVAGTYKIQAQTIANTNALTQPKNAAGYVIAKTITGAVSNALSTFSVV